MTVNHSHMNALWGAKGKSKIKPEFPCFEPPFE